MYENVRGPITDQVWINAKSGILLVLNNSFAPFSSHLLVCAKLPQLCKSKICSCFICVPISGEFVRNSPYFFYKGKLVVVKTELLL